MEPFLTNCLWKAHIIYTVVSAINIMTNIGCMTYILATSVFCFLNFCHHVTYHGHAYVSVVSRTFIT